MAKSLTLIDLEDFLPTVQLNQAQSSIDKDDNFIQNQYTEFIKVTSDATAIDYRAHKKLKAFKQFVLTENEEYKRNKVRRNYLFNLIYNKYMFDIQAIKSQNVFNNFYFQPQENGIIKQFFVASVQILFTILLSLEIIVNFEDIDFENSFNMALAVIIMYLTYVLITPTVSSIVGDVKILSQYFHLNALNTVLNATTNIVLALVLPFVTFFVILNSETLTDVVLNATAIAFIIELDDDAATEVDAENWFVTASASFDNIFKRVVPFNDDIITNDIDKCSEQNIARKIEAIKVEIRNENTRMEYGDVSIGKKILHFARNVTKFVFAPILIFKYPYFIIADAVKRRDIRNDSDVNVTEHVTLSKPISCKTNEYDEILQNDEEEMKYFFTKIDRDRHNDFAVVRALKLNHEANDLINDYKYNDAHNKCTEAIYLLYEDEKINERTDDRDQNAAVNNLLSILHFNHGYALEKRAKQSWISEIITNQSGHTFTNYYDAIKAYERCQSYLDANDGKTGLCHKLISDIYYDLYEFDKSLHHYQQYSKICESDQKRCKDITKKTKMFYDKYLEILDDFRVHIYDENEENKCNQSHDIDSCPIKKLNAVLDDIEKHTLFKENNSLVGKYYFVLGEYYQFVSNALLSETKNIERKLKNANETTAPTLKAKLKAKLKDLAPRIQTYEAKAKENAKEAKKASNLYGWGLFKMSDNPKKELCQDIITAFTNSIEFEPQQPYYYFIRASVYNKLCQMQRLQKQDVNNVDFECAERDFEKAIQLNENVLFKAKLHLLHLDYEEALKCIPGVVELVGLNRNLHLWQTYYDVAFIDDEEGISSQGYKRFLARLSKATRAVFASCGTFDDLSGDDNRIHRKHFDAMIEKFNNRDIDLYDYQDIVKEFEISQDNEKHLDSSKSIKFISSILTDVSRHTVRNIFWKIYGVVECDDADVYGLTENEWTRFIKLLPPILLEMPNMDKMYHNYAGEDGIMDIDEFRKLCDQEIIRIIHKICIGFAT